LKLSKLPSVHIACACGHVEQLTGTMLAAAGVKPDQRLMGIERRLPSRDCDQRGQVIVLVKWHDAPTRPCNAQF
jgi:hypothetical protein